MTTTPTASPELPGLDRLEALADAVPEHLQLKGWYVAAPSFGQQHLYADNFKGQGRQHIASLPAHKTYFAGLAEFIAAFDPPTVKYLIALARRAQPEGEAPLRKCSKFGHRCNCAVDCDATKPHPSMAVTLSPLYGAQHAESGKEAGLGCGGSGKCGVGYLPCLGCVNCPSEDDAAQQAAAPGALPVQEQASTTRVTETKRAQLEARGYEVVGYVMQNSVNELCTLAHGRVEWLGKGTVTDYGTSAPGTPEAPKPPFPISDDEMAALRRFWECATDGEGYDVEKPMMQRLAEMGLVQRKSGSYYMSTDFGLYVLGEYTIQRVAQLDGGQEGGD